MISSHTIADETKNRELELYNDDFENLFNYREKIKDGSQPFLYLNENEDAPVAVLLHGLSDSPGSMREIAKVYQKLGFHVVSGILRDHGLKKEFREQARSVVKLENWRADIDRVLELAKKMSKGKKLYLVGYSLGGALSIDTIHRHPDTFQNLVLVAPMLKIKLSMLARHAHFLKKYIYSNSKGVSETAHFYPDFALNQTEQAFNLSQEIAPLIFEAAALLEFKKIKIKLYLTDADTTIDNNYAKKYICQISECKNNIVMYENKDKNNIVLHRDLPMSMINVNNHPNPHLNVMLSDIELFLKNQGDLK